MPNLLNMPLLSDWSRRFRIPENELAVVPGLFPLFLDPHSVSGKLSDAVSQFVADCRPVEALEALRLYLAKEEFQAARKLLQLRGDLNETQEACHLDQIQSAATSRIEQDLDEVIAHVRELRKLSVNDLAVRDLQGAVEEYCRYLIRIGRIGAAQNNLHWVRKQVEHHVASITARLEDRMAYLRARASEFPDEQRRRVERLLNLSKERLAQQELRLAENACERALVVLEGGELRDDVSRCVQPARPLESFPIGSTQLQQLLWEHDLVVPSGITDWDRFLDHWEIRNLRLPGGQVVQEAVCELVAAAASSKDGRFNVGSESPWMRFLRKLFEALVIAPSFTGMQQLRSGLGACMALTSKVTGPGSFLDAKPELWRNDPLIAICAKPKDSASFVQELLKYGIRARVVLVFSAEAMAKRTQDELRSLLGAAGAYPVILDESTILNVLCASEQRDRTNRFIATLARQLPHTLINPFRPDNAVSEAMFFGRETEIGTLLQSQASFAVFGGRKLGKTSLLQKVERVAGAEDHRCVAIYLDIRNLASDLDVKRKLLEALRSPSDPRKPWRNKFQGLMPERPDTFIEQMGRLASEYPDHRFLFLLDEADKMMQRSAQAGSERTLGWDLRNLCATHPQFRFVFAGFQDVYRAVRESLEGPWYNFIQLLELKVLKEEDAERLIVQSLGLLGCYFERPVLVMRILDYTACHASLVQQFCQRLFDLVARDAQPGLPVTIGSEHVEAVFGDRDFPQAVDRIIHVNVSGDTRSKRCLKLVLYAWIYRLYRPMVGAEPQEIISARTLYEFLETEFGSAEIGRVLSYEQMDSYLNDLLVLGVLDRSPDGLRYFLRNRHFARMLHLNYGPRLKSEISGLLAQIGEEREARQKRLWASAPGDRPGAYSPFTRSDEQLWRSTRASTILLLGGPAAGKSLALDWIQGQVFQQSNPSGRERIIRLDLHTAKQPWDVVGLLAKRLGVKGTTWEDVTKRLQQLSAPFSEERPCYVLLDNADVLANPEFLCVGREEVQGFLGLIHELATSTAHHLKFIVAGGVPFARLWVDWEDLFLGEVVRISIRRLSEMEIHDWAEGQGLAMGIDLATKLYQITSGHPFLLQQFFQHVGGNEVLVLPRHIQEFRRALEQPGGLRDEILNRLANRLDPVSQVVLYILRDVANTFDTDSLVTETLLEVSKEHKRAKALGHVDWEAEVRILEALDELEPVAGVPEVCGRLRPLSTWEGSSS